MNDRQHCVFMNPAAEEMTGFTLAEVQGRPLHDVIHHTRPYALTVMPRATSLIPEEHISASIFKTRVAHYITSPSTNAWHVDPQRTMLPSVRPFIPVRGKPPFSSWAWATSLRTLGHHTMYHNIITSLERGLMPVFHPFNQPLPPPIDPRSLSTHWYSRSSFSRNSPRGITWGLLPLSMSQPCWVPS